MYYIRENFRWMKILPIRLSYLCIAEKLLEKFFANAVKVAIFSMQFLMQDKNLT